MFVITASLQAASSFPSTREGKGTERSGACLREPAGFSVRWKPRPVAGRQTSLMTLCDSSEGQSQFIVFLWLAQFEFDRPFMSLHDVVNESRTLQTSRSGPHSVPVVSWRKDCDWRILSDHLLKRKKHKTKRISLFNLSDPSEDGLRVLFWFFCSLPSIL